jgi:hypothetical protein
MGTRIGAALLIVVSAFLMIGAEVSGVFGQPDLAVDYMVADVDGSLIPLVVD